MSMLPRSTASPHTQKILICSQFKEIFCSNQSLETPVIPRLLLQHLSVGITSSGFHKIALKHPVVILKHSFAIRRWLKLS
ncbi:hypothetical protein I308_106169 [Cryptococcus tetragattii IND107]|uniref:Uncharacterized protein n=1 Tax=Cryptococcus tetragattii IND107 TaxID=1296105 RepID=A0ABR3BJM0_9TREE